MQAAVIFDVDGVLLELTSAEEEIFFATLAAYVPAHELSRDWNSYRIRNDDDIITEILERYGRPATLKQEIVERYLATLQTALADGSLTSPKIPGADQLVQSLAPHVVLGIATANLRQAAALRLANAGLWHPLKHHATGADGGGHKHQILARLLKTLPLARDRIVYVGDNINDVTAGRENGVHFIGFSTDPLRREALANHGATNFSCSHTTTLDLIRHILGVCFGQVAE